MPPKPYLSFHPVTGGVLLSCLLLTGCATEKAITKQTLPLQDQMVRLEQEMAESREAASRAAQEQSTAALARQSVLGEQLADVQAGIQSMQDKLQAQDERATRTELRVDELAATLLERLAQAEGRLNDAAATEQLAATQVQAIKDKQDADAAASTALTERVAQAEQRLNDAAAAEQQAASQAQAIKDKQDADAAASTALTERVAQAEKRLNDAAAAEQQAASQAQAIKDKQDADAAAGAALAERRRPGRAAPERCRRRAAAGSEPGAGNQGQAGRRCRRRRRVGGARRPGRAAPERCRRAQGSRQRARRRQSRTSRTPMPPPAPHWRSVSPRPSSA